jgi:hypothetical protein
MKKIISILSILSIVLIVSCKKTQVCSCVTTTNIDGVIGEYPVNDSVIENLSKKDAFEACNAGDMQYTQGNETLTVNCDLK